MREAYNGKAADIWSLGVILYECVYGTLPFFEENPALLFEKIKAGEISFPASVSVSPAVKDLIKRMLNPDPVARINVQQIVSHPWLANSKIECYLKRSYQDKVDKSAVQDCFKIKEFEHLDLPMNVIVDRILKKRQDAFTVAYELIRSDKVSEYEQKNDKKVFCPREGETKEEEVVRNKSPADWVNGICVSLFPEKLLLLAIDFFSANGAKWTIQHKFQFVVIMNDLQFACRICRKAFQSCLDFKIERGNVVLIFDIIQQVYSFIMKKLLS